MQGWLLPLGEGKVSETSALPSATLQLWAGQHSLVWISSPEGSLKQKLPSFLQHRLGPAFKTPCHHRPDSMS